METWIIVIVALVATVVFVTIIDMILKCRAKRKLKRARRDNQLQISTAIANQQQERPHNQQPQSYYGGVNLIKPSEGDVYILSREIAPVHAAAVSAPVDPKQYGYPVRYEDIVQNEKYAKQMPYNPAFQHQVPYQQNY